MLRPIKLQFFMLQNLTKLENLIFEAINLDDDNNSNKMMCRFPPKLSLWLILIRHSLHRKKIILNCILGGTDQKHNFWVSKFWCVTGNLDWFSLWLQILVLHNILFKKLIERNRTNTCVAKIYFWKLFILLTLLF